MSYVTTIYPGYSSTVRDTYLSEKNMIFLKDKIRRELSIDFKQQVIIEDQLLSQVMHQILSERLEPVPLMNRRVIMTLVNMVKTDQIEVNKHLKWEEGYTYSQLLYDPVSKKGIDTTAIKLSNRLGKSRIRSSNTYYFT